MAPLWLHIAAVASLLLGGISALMIAADEVRCPQKMWVMNIVWPVNALYFGIFGLWAYFVLGRKSTKQNMAQNMAQMQGSDKPQEEPKDPIKKAEKKGMKPFWQIVAVGVTHCGAGCTLGDIVAEWIVFWTGWLIAGRALWPEYISDFALAYLFGIVFQFFAIAPMRNLGVKEGLIAAVKADTLSLTAFEIGLFGWMALTSFVFFPHPHIHPNDPVYWLMMQIGMVIGFGTSYPMNWWLVKRGIKEAM